VVGVIGTAFFSQDTVKFALFGLATGSLVALVALGIVLVYRASGVLNFAAGGMGAISAYLFYSLRDDHGVYWLVALVISLAAGGVTGILTQFLVMKVLRRVSLVGKLIATLGLMASAGALIAIVWGTESRGFPKSILSTELVTISDNLAIPEERLILIGLVIVLAIGLRLVYAKTMFGLATSAVAESRRVASSSGWSPNRIEIINFAVAGVLSAGAAILLAPIVGLNASTLTFIALPALAAALLGRFSSFFVTVAGALAIGVVGSEVGLFRPDIANALGVEFDALTGLADTVPLLIIILATVIGGRARLARGESTTRLPLPGSGRVHPALLAIGVAIAGVLLLTLDATWTSALITTFAGGILILSVIMVTGYGGQLSLCQFALAGFGAWVAARLVATAGFPFELALVAGVLLTIPVGLIVALPALRTRGVNLAVATLGLALMINAVVFNSGPLTGGFVGTVVESPTLFGIELDPIGHPERYAAFVLVMFVLAGLVVANVRRGRSGRRLLAVRGNERAAASLGISVYGAKLYAFGVAGAIAGLSGVLFAFRNEHVQFLEFGAFGSITAVLNSVLGGLGWAAGSIVGSLQSAGGINTLLLTKILPSSQNISFYLVLLSSAGVVGILASSPDGIAALISKHFGPRLAKLSRGTSRPQVPGVGEPRRDRQPVPVEMQGLTVRFGGVVALDDVSFTVRPGEILGLIGPNGAGKTTLLDVATGFTKPTEGTVLLDGVPVDGWGPERRARAGMARSWQSVELFEEMTVHENLLVASDRQQRRRYLTDLIRPGRQRITEAMADAISDFKLEPYLEARPSSLPQGVGRVTGIARAMVTEPVVLFLDEPAAGLDTQESRELGLGIRRVAAERGIGVLLIEHDIALLMDVCDRMVVLDFGRKLAEGTPLEISRHPDVVRAYLGQAREPKPARSTKGVGEVTPRIEVRSEPQRDPQASPAPTVLEARVLDAGYGQIRIVRGLDLEVRAGEIVALLGPNGAGKTTTLLTLAGELPPLGGEVFLHGTATTAPFYRRVRDGLGLVSEERTVLMQMTVADNLRVNQGDSDLALELFPELEPHLKRRVAMLSGGQQQMLALARALSRRPSVLLADELSLGLAPLVVDRLMSAVRTAADDGVGVLLVEQHIHRALELADRSYLLLHGQVELSGDSHDLADRIDEIQGAYLSASAGVATVEESV
jgi:ABC-type branched-subunit amino acid transport system ATPase component/branched-subunit amino acid ABC-type transport system permease component